MEQVSRNLPKLYIKNSIQRVESNDIAILKEHGIQLSKLNKDNPQQLLTAIAIMIQSVYELVNVGKKISEQAIVLLAKMIVEKYWYLKIDEIEYALKQGIMGNFGTIYDRIDAQVIFEWLYKYEVSEEVIGIYENQVESYRKMEREHDSPILESAEFRERLKTHIGFENLNEAENISLEDHRAMIRLQAKKLMEQSSGTK